MEYFDQSLLTVWPSWVRLILDAVNITMQYDLGIWILSSPHQQSYLYLPRNHHSQQIRQAKPFFFPGWLEQRHHRPIAPDDRNRLERLSSHVRVQ